ncbi:MAG: methyltransferase domain-containing protein [Bacilli bacterium]|jgi:NOL1/NOP2/sun family putative RNA methylase
MKVNISFAEHLKKYLDDKTISDLLSSLAKDEIKGLFLNERIIDSKTMVDNFPFLRHHPLVNNAFIYDKNECEMSHHYLYALGTFYIQEPSSCLTASLVKFTDGDLILDMCAAPGGKAISLACRNPHGVVVANDISKERIDALINNIERMGIDNVAITNNDFTNSDIARTFKDRFDAILLDAPCSGSGMFRKMKEMRDDWTYAKVIRCQEIQKKLIINAYQMLKPGGCLVYSTCSYSCEENEEIVKFLLSKTDAQVLNIDDSKLFYKSGRDGAGIHLFPNLYPGEGQYIARLVKPGIKNKTLYKSVSQKDENVLHYRLESRDNIATFNALYSLNKRFDYKPLRIVRYGVKALERKGDELVPTHHLARCGLSLHTIAIASNDFLSYVSGREIIIKTNFKGWAIATYNGLNIGLIKIASNRAKNHYPKGLRFNKLIM